MGSVVRNFDTTLLQMLYSTNFTPAVLRHYVYYSYEEWGRGYIGVRSCKCSPEKDIKYFGSFKDKTFKPTSKIILKEFLSRQDANKAEILLHNFYDIAVNPHFANLAKSTSEGFCAVGWFCSDKKKEKLKQYRTGKKHTEETKKKIGAQSKNRVYSEETRRKLSLIHLNKPKTAEHRRKLSEVNKGKKLTIETKEKISKAGKGKKRTAETKEKISKALKGKKRTKEQILQNRLRQKSCTITLKNVTTNEIISFISQSEAARFLNKSPATINSMVKGRIKYSNGHCIA